MPKVDLSKVPIAPKTAEARYRSAFDAIEDTKEEMRKMGLDDYPKPKTQPPALSEVGDIDGLTNAQLGGLYVRYVAHAQFIGARLAETVAGYKIAISNLKHLQAELTAKMFSQNVPKGEIATRVRENALYREFDAELVKMFAMKTLLEAHHRAYDKQAAALSRMISLRELEFQQTLRQEGIKKPKPKYMNTSNIDLRKDDE